jgi:hypothetical protein
VFGLPIATWEFSLGVYMTIKGFRDVAADALADSDLAMSRQLVNVDA